MVTGHCVVHILGRWERSFGCLLAHDTRHRLVKHQAAECDQICEIVKYLDRLSDRGVSVRVRIQFDTDRVTASQQECLRLVGCSTLLLT